MEEKTIRTEARIDATGAPKLDLLLKQSLAAGENKLIIDMTDTSYISSIGLRAFAATQKALRGTDGYMILRNVAPKVMELFEITGFAGVLTIE